jgi:hypothetical protein
MASNLSRQFQTGKPDDGAKSALLEQLGKSFHEKDLEWIHDPQIHVSRETVSPGAIDWDHRDEWAATHEPKEVKKKRKKIEKGHDKPVVLVDRPHKGPDNLFIMDGHHHAEAYTQLDKDMPAFTISVPKTNGPWDTLHDKQEHNKNA